MLMSQRVCDSTTRRPAVAIRLLGKFLVGGREQLISRHTRKHRTGYARSRGLTLAGRIYTCERMGVNAKRSIYNECARRKCSHAKAQRCKEKHIETRQRFASLRLCVKHLLHRATFRAKPPARRLCTTHTQEIT